MFQAGHSLHRSSSTHLLCSHFLHHRVWVLNMLDWRREVYHGHPCRGYVVVGGGGWWWWWLALVEVLLLHVILHRNSGVCRCIRWATRIRWHGTHCR
ncbi:hypothetical protein HanRHA438_Chr09g0402441 [Helianthus annuus]|nr:hypothetical protein HanIR_Chr09g0421511 [Helianthus annuus]KAJ0888477.1 hypothetical protein HanRHA438_Chr09g0402441 [Helianthus annuus]